jgi:hypothetical protein
MNVPWTFRVFERAKALRKHELQNMESIAAPFGSYEEPDLPWVLIELAIVMRLEDFLG